MGYKLGWKLRRVEMVHVISVTPAQGGWTVSAEPFANPMAFLSGAKAEAAARSLAEKIIRRGELAEIRVVLRDGSLEVRSPVRQ
jgi:hypothetical protein